MYLQVNYWLWPAHLLLFFSSNVRKTTFPNQISEQIYPFTMRLQDIVQSGKFTEQPD